MEETMNVYVASSWRNERQPEIVAALRGAAHSVYDFRNPRDSNCSFHFSNIDPKWESWTPEEYVLGLSHPIAESGFRSDMEALQWCDAVVAVQPFGRSASLELGWACGAGKFTVLLLADGEPELMVKMCNKICLSVEAMLESLNEFQAGS